MKKRQGRHYKNESNIFMGNEEMELLSLSPKSGKKVLRDGNESKLVADSFNGLAFNGKNKRNNEISERDNRQRNASFCATLQQLHSKGMGINNIFKSFNLSFFNFNTKNKIRVFFLIKS